ncbi:MAG: DNA topoisomerase (ATP-hydrolyzing) subunit B [Candidatus Babeliaceae bacterium]|jgi:DNA gyrase subunit B
MSNKSPKSNQDYSAQSIKILEGLEAVRKRPAMYIGSTGAQGLHHLVYEIVDNSVDEALAGHCTAITVMLHEDGSCSVQDNGRGIPIDIHSEGISAAEVVFTKLHAGGKFDKESYKFSGGLHGVGSSVVNALSEWLIVTIFKNGIIYEQKYERGTPVTRLIEKGPTSNRGTLVRFKPDAEIFKDTVEFNFETLSARMRELAFLNKGLRISISDANTNKNHEFFFEGGIVSFIQHVNAKKTPLFNEVIYFEKRDENSILEIAFQYNDSFGEQLFSFVNNINTIEGGTHVAGFKGALTKACNKKATEMGLLKGSENFSSDDVREGIVCVINMKVAEPQFEGQTKAKLGNSDVKGIVESWTFSFLENYFEENPLIARKILQKAELAMQARDAAKKARELTRRKTVLESTILPGKLADCSTENPTEGELFIVEGDSAGGSAKQGRDRHTQAILPLKGKILNVEKSRLDKILGNDEIKALIAAVGCGIGTEDFSIDKARYHKIILMTDADVDGAHIRTLLLTFFFRYMKPLIEAGYLYIAQPPLYKAKIGKKEQYLKDDKFLKEFLTTWARENTTISVDNITLSPEEFNVLLDDVARYEQELEHTSQKFKLTHEQCHALVNAVAHAPLLDVSNLESILAVLVKAFSTYTITVMDQSITQAGSTKFNPLKTYICFKRLNLVWYIDTDFFSAPELNVMLGLTKPLSMLENNWTIKIHDKERSVTGTGILELISGIIKISKPYMSIQRYKGLGEMNPEQLWETSMDAKTRLLLQVSIGDALEADAWFDTLMGDDVSGRRTFIEENGHFVKNLDI